MPHTVITIGRQFGSGGRELGRLIAQKMGISFYDKELLQQAAQHAGVCTEIFERGDERAPKFYGSVFNFNMGISALSWYNGPSAISDDSIYRAQSDFIRMLAQRESCVIVGRSADYILRDMPGVVNIFVHAPLDVCARRIMQRNDTDDIDKARAMALKVNKLRANYYNFYTEKRWGDATSYHLSIDSSTMPMDKLADMVIEYAKHHAQTQQPSTPAPNP